MGSGRIQLKPYEQERWFYLDELDVAVDQRQRGAGAALVKGCLELARAEGCTELWLGTELDNAAARALYRSFKPSDEEAFVGYNFRL
jgi:ribosomal protein S18 acetylase RimI-like enzyme